MASVNPHILFNGDTEEAFLFYQSIFGGKFSKLVRYKDIPVKDFQFPENELEKIMHIALQIGDTSVLTGSDVPEILGRVNENENRSKITISAKSKEEADKIFNGLAAGGVVEMPISSTSWCTYFGALRDKYGIEWMIDFTEA